MGQMRGEDRVGAEADGRPGVRCEGAGPGLEAWCAGSGPLTDALPLHFTGTHCFLVQAVATALQLTSFKNARHNLNI